MQETLQVLDMGASITTIGTHLHARFYDYGTAFSDCPTFFTVHPDNPVYIVEKGELVKKERKNETY